MHAISSTTEEYICIKYLTTYCRAVVSRPHCAITIILQFLPFDVICITLSFGWNIGFGVSARFYSISAFYVPCVFCPMDARSRFYLVPFWRHADNIFEIEKPLSWDLVRMFALAVLVCSLCRPMLYRGFLLGICFINTASLFSYQSGFTFHYCITGWKQLLLDAF